MKRLLTVTFCLLCFAGKAQPISAATIAAMRAHIYTAWTAQTGFHALTHDIQGHDMDTIWACLGILSNAIASTNGLQGVLNSSAIANNTSGNTGAFALKDSTAGYYRSFWPYYDAIYNLGGTNQLFWGISAGVPIGLMKDAASSYSAKFFSGPLTANRAYLWPDEGTGSGLSSTIMLHQSSNPFTCTSGSNIGTWGYNSASIYDGAGNNISMDASAFQVSNTTGGVTNLTQVLYNKLYSSYFDGISTVKNFSLYFPVGVSGSASTAYADTIPDTSGMLVNINARQSLYNKKVVTKRLAYTSNATPVINTDVYDYLELSAQSGNITSISVTGTPFVDQVLHISVKATTNIGISGFSSDFEASSVPFPTAVGGGTRLDMYFVYTSYSKWRLGGIW